MLRKKFEEVDNREIQLEDLYKKIIEKIDKASVCSYTNGSDIEGATFIPYSPKTNNSVVVKVHKLLTDVRIDVYYLEDLNDNYTEFVKSYDDFMDFWLHRGF